MSEQVQEEQKRKIVNKKVHFPCDFCGKFSNELEVLIQGPLVAICDECVETCTFIIEEHREKKMHPDIKMLRES